MAPGRAGSNARRELYREYETVPARGPLAALTVPGAVSGWMLALEAARAQGGRMPLPDLLAPAIRHANDGYIVTPGQARLTAENLAELKDVPGFAATFLTDGKPPDAGRRLHQSALAATLDHLAHAGLDDFYRGDVGREIAADLERVGSPVTRDDLERCCASAAEPLSVALDCGTAFNTPPPTQGLASLMILALFERLRAARRRLRGRERPDRDDQARLRRARPRHHRSRAPAASARSLPRAEISRCRSAQDRPPQGRALARSLWRRRHGVDGRRRCDRPRRFLHPVALLGVRLRRGAAADRRRHAEPRRELLAAGALNALVPGRLPFHTLNPALVVLADGRVIGYGAMGGDGQPQTQAALFTRHVRYGMALDRAIDAPRWLLGRTWGSSHTNLRLEARFDDELVDRLLSAGHDVEVLPDAYSDVMGHAGAVVLHGDGTLEGVHDPRANGGAAGV